MATITRTPIVDDDGTGTTGTILNNVWKQELYGQIDAVVGTAPIALLRATAGQTAATGNANLDQVPISGLTALDCLEVFWLLQNGSLANASAIRVTTASESIGIFVPSLAANTVVQGRAVLRQGVGQSTVCGCVSEGLVSGAGRVDNFAYGVITIPWTGSWTLTFQALGLPGGGLNWAWNVYRRKGQ
jgi:hypothetical protein